MHSCRQNIASCIYTLLSSSQSWQCQDFESSFIGYPSLTMLHPSFVHLLIASSAHFPFDQIWSISTQITKLLGELPLLGMVVALAGNLLSWWWSPFSSIQLYCSEVLKRKSELSSNKQMHLRKEPYSQAKDKIYIQITYKKDYRCLIVLVLKFQF